MRLKKVCIEPLAEAGTSLDEFNVPQRIVYKLCTIIYMCLHQTAPVYL